MNRVFSAAVSIPKTCVRHLSATEIRCNDRLSKIKQQQMFFQKDDNVPVYLKKGASDKLLFLLSSSLIVFSFTTALYYTYTWNHRK